MSLSSTEARICMRDRSFAMTNSGGAGLADVHRALDDDAVDRRVDVGVREVLLRALEVDLRRRQAGLRLRVARLCDVVLRVGRDLLIVQLLAALVVELRLRVDRLC